MPTPPPPTTSTPLLIRPALLHALPGLVAAFTTRHGGVSAAPFTSLNLGLSTADADEQVATNRARVGTALGISPERWIIAGQVHGADVLTTATPGLYPGYDGLVTAARNVLLCISAADCAAVLFADPEAGVLGACHAGWRGTVAGIVPATIRQMQALGAAPERIYAYVSPCISVDNFEVGPEVAAQFDAAVVQQPAGKRKPHVDLKAALRNQLHDAGVPDAQIEISPACTVGASDTFFSYRGETGQTGRMMGLIGWKTAEGKL